MKQRIFMYLFVFTLLLFLFQYVNSKKIIDAYEKDIKVLKEHVEQADKEIDTLQAINQELMYFNIENDEDALTYFEKMGYDTSKLIPYIENELYDLINNQEGDDRYMPYASLTGNIIGINKVLILNHKWIICDFSDGTYWGQLFFTYELDDEGKVSFELKEHFLYPPSRY